MLTEADQRTVREPRCRLMTIALTLDPRVFGSRARGNAAPDSGLGLSIELEEARPELRQRTSEIAWEVDFEMNWAISTIGDHTGRP